MKSRSIIALAGCAAVAFLPSVALGQRQPPPTPEQRIERLEKQVQQVQRQVFPKGRPADTAGFSDDPAATQSSVMSLDQRLDAVEKQMADLVRQSEENGNRLRTLESGISQLKNDQDQRITAIEQRLAAAAAAPPVVTQETAPPPAAPPPRTRAGGRATSEATSPAATEVGNRWSHARQRSGRGRLHRRFPPMGGGPIRPGDRHAQSLHRRLSQAPARQLRQQPHRQGAPRQGRCAKCGQRAARQLPQQSRRRARAGQPVLSRAGVVETRPADAGVQGL